MLSQHPLWRPFTPEANSYRQAQRVAARQTRPGPVREHDPDWAIAYETVRPLIAATLPDQVMHVRHVGFTAVPGMFAKPVIDIDLTVPDCNDEAAYLPRLEAVGFRLIFRDALAGDRHRQLTFAQPNTNLHLWSLGAIEPRRHAMFVDWLREHPDDCVRYSQAKLAAFAGGANYNDGKAAVVYDIYERVFAADQAHDHEPQPRADVPE